MPTKTKIRIATYSTALLIVLLWVRGLFHKEPIPQDAIQSLPTNAVARISVQPHNVVAVQTSKGTKAFYVPPSGNSTITVNKNGNVDISTKNRGVTLHVGGGLGYIDGFRPTVDVQLLYWDRLGLYGGVALGVRPVLVPYLAIGYRLDEIHLDNTSLFAGYTTQKDFIVGLRVEF